MTTILPYKNEFHDNRNRRRRNESSWAPPRPSRPSSGFPRSCANHDQVKQGAIR